MMKINFQLFSTNFNYIKANTSFLENSKKFFLLVNSELTKLEKLKKQFILKQNVPVYQLLIQSQKTKIYLELLTKIRDEALKAYNTIVNLKI